MNKLKLVNRLKNLFNEGQNLMDFLRSYSDGNNDIESIMISYDFQSGSYIEFAKNNSLYINKYTDAILKELNQLDRFNSIMEVGIGEATIMSPLMKKFDPDNKINKLGFDISWSRVRYGLAHSLSFEQKINLFVANLFEIPLPDNSVDVVYTSHSLEPNGGKEKEALAELFRVSSKYVVLLEPDFEGGNEEAKKRMTYHGYVKNLDIHAKELGYNVIINRSFEVFANPLNPTRLIIIKKSSDNDSVPEYQCPITKTALKRYRGNLYSEESGLLYPEIDGIPCLTENQAIFASHYLKFS